MDAILLWGRRPPVMVRDRRVNGVPGARFRLRSTFSDRGLSKVEVRSAVT